ncbi:MAG: alpha-L-fucosidase [Pirellulaceae bacterium]
MHDRTRMQCGWLTIVLMASALRPAVGLEPPEVAWDMLTAKPEIVEAWKDMRFGMFVCWGPVSVTGLEVGWSRGKAWPHQQQGGTGPTPADVYDDLYKTWQPDAFDARAWVKVAQDMGARYMIFLVKHHDGFCLFDTQLTDYRITGPASAWKHDVMKDVADACHEAGLKLILYYSQPDWHHPDYRTENHARYVEYFHGQIRELLTNYGRIDGLWFDLGGTPEEWQTEKLFKMARSIQPWLIINNRVGLPGDFDTPENQVGFFQNKRPWETCYTLGKQWSWKPDDVLCSFEECIQVLVSCATGDGNLALNTGPMPNGAIEPRQVEVFQSIGKWLDKYGESVYGTRGGPFIAPDARLRSGKEYYSNFQLAGGRWWGGSTHTGNTIYLHILRWPGETITLPAIEQTVLHHSVLTGGTVTVKQTEQGIEVCVPSHQRDPVDTIVKLELSGAAKDVPVIKPVDRSGSLAYGRTAAASNVYQLSSEYSPDKAFDDDPDTRWGCDWGTHSCWLEVDLGQARTFRRALLSEPFDRVQEFELQVLEDGQWRTFHCGKTIGERCEVQFPPVTAQRVRLNILDTTDGPSIWEFQLFE